jgi:hypothetical protein
MGHVDQSATSTQFPSRVSLARSALVADKLAVTATVTVGYGPVGLASDGTNIWVTNFRSRTDITPISHNPVSVRDPPPQWFCLCPPAGAAHEPAPARIGNFFHRSKNRPLSAPYGVCLSTQSELSLGYASYPA